MKTFDHQAYSSKAVARNCSVEKVFHITDGKKTVSDKYTNVFLSILQDFQEQFFYWTPSVAVSFSFKATGFTEAVIQTNFWISQNLVDLNTLSSS